MKKEMFRKDTSIGLKRFFRSFRHALNGIEAAYKDEENLLIHTILAVVVIALAFIFRVNVTEWLFLVFAITLVMLTELFNSAIERTVDCATMEINANAKAAKDIAAAAVLFAALIALIVGCVIFIPRIIALF